MKIKELKEKSAGFNDEDEICIEENNSDLLYGISDIRIYDVKRVYVNEGKKGQKQLVLSRDLGY